MSSLGGGSGARVVVVGGGTMGLATAWALARRGATVTVLERFGHVHDRGSHGGHTRVIRQAYHEGSTYVPLIRDAQRQWLALGRRTDRTLLVQTGLLLFGPPGEPELTAAIDTCRACDLPHRLEDGREVGQRWPLTMPADWQTCFEPAAGYLRVQACLDALADEARAAGARLEHGVAVEGLERGAELAVRCADGRRVPADRLVVAAGAWLPALVPDGLPGRVRRLRRILAWTDPAPEHHPALAGLPVWGGFVGEGFFYGFPYGDEGTRGLKLAVHTAADMPGLDEAVDPDTVDRTAHPADLEPLRRVLADHLPSGQGPFVATHACLYAQTPDWSFVVDRLPDDPRVVVAGGFSGHGFKFAPAIGLHVAALLLDDAEPHAEFRIDRAATAG